MAHTRLCTLLTSNTDRDKVKVSTGSSACALLQEQLTPRNGLKKAPSERQPFQQTPEHEPRMSLSKKGWESHPSQPGLL